ncbi:HAMP domain-containing sensor histidine kinase [Pannus brasiliensis CCIBt3594]|uniref:histidine kinase n=1 Tax=Pannus brasiliensis CCIBt3594 TaxID=1427578 RepID=A0AAW9QDY6_9CHRO
MTFFAFILGIVLGLAICYWQISRSNRELKRLLTAQSDAGTLARSFPVTSLVRRELQFLEKRTRQLEETLAIQKSLLDRAPVGYLHVDADNQLLWCNRQAIELLTLDRWQPEQVRLLLELVRSYELDQLIQETRDSQNQRERVWTFYPTNSIADPSGDRSVSLKGYGYPLPNGEVGVFIENQQPLVELSRTRERAFSDLTHELRTPLTSISLTVETLRKRLQDPERRWIEQMAGEVERLISLVRDWLEISDLQADSGRSLQYTALDLQEPIETAWQSVTPLAERKNITRERPVEGEWILEGDRSRLLQVFVNLFDNAIKYSPAGGKIRVAIGEIPDTDGESRLQIDVIDSGEGFHERDLPRVFDRLYRGDPSRARTDDSPAERGTGLGLSIAREIVRAHGGAIVARNDPETGGGWIQVTLPRSRPKSVGDEKSYP